jgi:hypothetical protein
MKQFKFLRNSKHIGWTFESQMLVQLLTHCKRNDIPFEGADHIYNDYNNFPFLMKIVVVNQHRDYWLFYYSVKNLTTNMIETAHTRVSNSVIRDLLYVEEV